jgi:hypothetical protein
MITTASDQSMIAVAFPGALMGYNFQGVNTVQFNTDNVGEIQSLDWLDGVGPIAIAQGTVYIWSSNGSLIT